MSDILTVTPTFSYVEEKFDVSSPWWTNLVGAVDEAGAGHKKYTGNIAFPCGSTNSIDVELKLEFNFASDDDAVTYGNKAYNVDITFGEANKGTARPFDWLYVRGEKTNWEASNDYRLVPNLLSDKKEFMFAGLPGNFGELKLANEDWTVSAGTGDQNEGNLTPSAPDATYGVYWHGDIQGKLPLYESTDEHQNHYINAGSND